MAYISIDDRLVWTTAQSDESHRHVKERRLRIKKFRLAKALIYRYGRMSHCLFSQAVAAQNKNIVLNARCL